MSTNRNPVRLPAWNPQASFVIFSVIVAVTLLVASRASAGDSVVIKLGTLVPEGSVWYKSLREADQRIRTATEGRVKFKIYPGGVSGNESAIIRKIRIGQLHAGSISAVGLIDIDRSPLALQLPRLITSFDELRYVRDKMEGYLDQRIEEKHFKVLAWAEVGWTYFFTREPVTTPEALKRVKMYAWEGDPPATQAFLKVGLKPVTVPSTDVLPALQTGMIDGFPTSALSALSFQWFGLCKYMLNIKWAPMIGATVVSLRTWNRISPDDQAKVLAIMRDVIQDLNERVLQLDRDAIEEMKKYGLQVVEPQDMAAWERFAEAMRNAMRGEVVTPESMDLVIKYHQAYQQAHAGGGAGAGSQSE